jgi:hypothetical protein
LIGKVGEFIKDSNNDLVDFEVADETMPLLRFLKQPNSGLVFNHSLPMLASADNIEDLLASGLVHRIAKAEVLLTELIFNLEGEDRAQQISALYRLSGS